MVNEKRNEKWSIATLQGEKGASITLRKRASPWSINGHAKKKELWTKVDAQDCQIDESLHVRNTSLACPMQFHWQGFNWHNHERQGKIHQRKAQTLTRLMLQIKTVIALLNIIISGPGKEKHEKRVKHLLQWKKDQELTHRIFSANTWKKKKKKKTRLRICHVCYIHACKTNSLQFHHSSSSSFPNHAETKHHYPDVI